MKKQGVDFEEVYDLFAVRIIIKVMKKTKNRNAGEPILL